MGAKQSKRSVDISGKEAESAGEVAAAGAGGEGRMEQLADVDALKPQVNGDAHIHETTEKEKDLDSGTPENEKDATTEKEVKDAEENEKVVPITNGENEPKTENGESTPSPDDGKKHKKEKVKKKWSLRSISFSRKDKPKQEKKQKDEDIKTNGEPEKVPEEIAETVPEVKESAEEIQAEPESKDEKTPDTPVTEPLTNGSSTPETPKEEKPIPEEPETENPSDVRPETKKEIEPENLPVDRLTLEESKKDVSEIPEIDSNKIEEPMSDIIEKLPASEIIVQKEVCVEQAPLLESSPPPLPAHPPPSSVASFAATTMAPELSDASLANKDTTHIAPDSTPENIDVASSVPLTTEIAVADCKSDISPVPIIDSSETQTTLTNTPEQTLQNEVLTESLPTKVDHEDITVVPVEQATVETIILNNHEIVSQSITEIKTEVRNEVESLDDSVSETIEDKHDSLDNTNTPSPLEQNLSKELSNNFEQDSGICESKESDVDSSIITHNDVDNTDTPSETLNMKEKIEEIVKVTENVSLVNGESEILTNGDRTPPAELIEGANNEKEIVVSEDSLPPSLSEEIQQPQVGGLDNDEISESFPLPPSELCPTETEVSPPASPEPACKQTTLPQDILPIADKMAELIPEIPTLPDLNTETETTTDVAVAN